MLEHIELNVISLSMAPLLSTPSSGEYSGHAEFSVRCPGASPKKEEGGEEEEVQRQDILTSV